MITALHDDFLFYGGSARGTTAQGILGFALHTLVGKRLRNHVQLKGPVCKKCSFLSHTLINGAGKFEELWLRVTILISMRRNVVACQLEEAISIARLSRTSDYGSGAAMCCRI